MNKSNATLMVFCGDATATLNRRPDLMRAFSARFTRCVLVSPTSNLTPSDREEVRALGFELVPLEFATQGMGVTESISVMRGLRRVLRRERPEHLFVFHLKPILLGSIAARWVGVPNVHVLFAGLGILFSGPRKGKAKLIGAVVNRGLRFGLRHARTIFFQNSDDPQTLREQGIIDASSPVHLVNGSGVPLDQFVDSEVPTNPPLAVVLITRVLHDKGIKFFCEAASEVEAKLPGKTQFKIIGPLDFGPNGVPEQTLNLWCESHGVCYAGETKDVLGELEKASIVALPSYYMEGTPRILLEALSVGRPIITTNSRGCRETVIDGKNGLLVEPRSTEMLANAVIQLATDHDALKQMGRESRRYAEEKFDVRIVNRVMLDKMGMQEGFADAGA